jgi:hypothetical protein
MVLGCKPVHCGGECCQLLKVTMQFYLGQCNEPKIIPDFYLKAANFLTLVHRYRMYCQITALEYVHETYEFSFKQSYVV